MIKRLLTLSLLAAALPALADEQVLRFYGYAYDLKSGKYLYTEVHEQHVQGDRWIGGTMTYFDPQGHQIGRKTLDFSKDSCIPTYHLTLNGSGYEEGISSVGDKIDMFKRHAAGEAEEHASLDKTTAMAADSGFHIYIRSHFAELMAGQTVAFKLIVPGNLDAFKFRIRRIGDTQFEGLSAIRLLVEPDSLLRFLVDPLELTYEPKERKLLEYRGISNVHDASGKAYTARIAFYSKPPADAPRSLPLLQ
jgi:hypothetical protein